MNRCGCSTLGNAWLMCPDHHAAFEAELRNEPRPIAALINMLTKEGDA